MKIGQEKLIRKIGLYIRLHASLAAIEPFETGINVESKIKKKMRKTF